LGFGIINSISLIKKSRQRRLWKKLKPKAIINTPNTEIKIASKGIIDLSSQIKSTDP